MKRADQERMLSEIFADGSAAARTGSLALGLQALRRRRRHRAAIVSTSTLSVLVAGFLLFRSPGVPPRVPSANVAVHAAGQVSDLPHPNLMLAPANVKMLTDAELLALFRDRPVALIGTPGEQRLIFLDESFASASPARPE
jgi:hypothetical protein